MIRDKEWLDNLFALITIDGKVIASDLGKWLSRG